MVVTGGASGIGLGLAKRFSSRGAAVALADVEADALDEAVDGIEASGGRALGAVVDVSDAEAVEALAERVTADLGAVDVVCNNAGVGVNGPLWTASLADWRWVLDVNLCGVIHGVRAFVPGMVDRGRGHVVNTASLAGLVSYPEMGVYNVSKHGVATLSETLWHELRRDATGVGVTVVCPGLVNTRIIEADRNRPDHLRSGDDQMTGSSEERRAAARAVYDQAMSPDALAAVVVDAVEADRLYVIPDAAYDHRLRQRHEAIEGRRDPEVIRVPLT